MLQPIRTSDHRTLGRIIRESRPKYRLEAFTSSILGARCCNKSVLPSQDIIIREIESKPKKSKFGGQAPQAHYYSSMLQPVFATIFVNQTVSYLCFCIQNDNNIQTMRKVFVSHVSRI